MINEEKIIEAAVKFNEENYSQIDNDFQNALNITSVKSFIAGAEWAINLKEKSEIKKNMGLDVTVRKIKKKHIVEDMTIEQMFENGSFVHDFCKRSGIEEWVDSMDFTELEMFEALAYKILLKEKLPNFTKNNWKIEEIKEMYGKFDENEFIYIARFDW